MENSLQKVNEARGIGQTSPELLLLGGETTQKQARSCYYFTAFKVEVVQVATK